MANICGSILGVVLASVKARDQTAVPVKFQEEAQLTFDSFTDSKLSSSGLEEDGTEAAPPTSTAQRPRSKAAAGRSRAAAKPELKPS